MKKLVAAALLFAPLAACEVTKTDEGHVDLPDYEVKKTSEGSADLPNYDVKPADVDVQERQRAAEVKVPDVDVKVDTKRVNIPDIDVDIGGDKDDTVPPPEPR